MTTSFRVKTGCLTCRGRRKKCDERKPNCTGCTRNFLRCDWPELVVNKDGVLKAKSGTAEAKAMKTKLPASGRRQTPAQLLVFAVDLKRPITVEQDLPPSPEVTFESTVCEESITEDTADRSLTLWRSLTASFMSDERPTLLTPHSVLLLQHYLEDTACFLVPKIRTRNPFITQVLPLAYSDDLLMHAVMSLSGTHLSYQQKDNLDVQLATRKHYSLLLRGLRKAFADEAKQPCSERSLRLLVILVVLCHVEARTIPLDPFITSFELLREYETFGIFLSCGQGLFETIPKICIFAMNRLAEEEQSYICSTETQQEYDELVSTLLLWSSPPVDPEMIEYADAHVTTGEIYRQALLMFVKTSMCGSVVSNPKVITELQGHIEVITDAMPIVNASPFATVLLWPLMITGSCITSPRERLELMKRLEHTEIDVMQVSQAASLLRLLWEDKDERAFGPFGLHLIMQKHNIMFSMA
ncbi:hypothetical protein LTR84_011765 [Exophiala bonariae]|uniref:Zn(2)-C6 fungal-type domain-containing protein n=1 Tax=Exophiala bonariae TaxID=1690606 RepID=A0AAV9NHC7_9EURO|nr:hypothetical protein LTR84_011765 [Exophiala bonariae]